MNVLFPQLMVNVTGFVSKLFAVPAPVVAKNPYSVGTEEPFGIENRVFPEELGSEQDPDFVTPVRETENDDSDSESSSQITLSSDEDESNYKMMDSLVYPDMSADFDAEVEEAKEEQVDSPHPNITLFRGSRPSNSDDDADDEFLMTVNEEEDAPHPNITLFRGSRPSNPDAFLMNIEDDDAPHPNFTLFRGSRAYDHGSREYEMNDSDDEVFADREDNSDSDEDEESTHDEESSIRPFEHWSIHELGDLSSRAHVVAGTSGAQAVNYARVSFSDEVQESTTPVNTPTPSPIPTNHVNIIPYESSDYEPEYNYDEQEEDGEQDDQEEQETNIDYQIFHPTPCMICEEHVTYQNVYENSCCENIFCRDCLMGYARTHLMHGSKIICPKCRISIDSIKRY